MDEGQELEKYQEEELEEAGAPENAADNRHADPEPVSEEVRKKANK